MRFLYSWLCSLVNFSHFSDLFCALFEIHRYFPLSNNTRISTLCSNLVEGNTVNLYLTSLIHSFSPFVFPVLSSFLFISLILQYSVCPLNLPLSHRQRHFRIGARLIRRWARNPPKAAQMRLSNYQFVPEKVCETRKKIRFS